MSAFDVIRHEFEDPHSQSFMLWMAFQTLTALDRAGTGLLAYSLLYGRQQNSWSIPIGGSGTLIDSLVGYLEQHDVQILCNHEVSELLLEGDRCVGVETTTGQQFMGRKGVISTIHIKHLVDMAPKSAWGEDFLYGVDTYEVGISGFAAYMATTEPPVFDTPDGGRTAVSAGIVGWPDQVLRSLREVQDGIANGETPPLLVATPTLVDTSRTVDNLHTVKLLSAVSYELPDGETWETAKEVLTDRYLALTQKYCSNFTADKIVDRIVRSPDDLEANNAHMIRGAFHGGDRTPANSGVNRPVPGWAQHRMPIQGLYQTGGTTHPGGSITGAPGRNAAIIVLEDLGHPGAMP
jgi:phytoene dehydrogenase-like protein